LQNIYHQLPPDSALKLCPGFDLKGVQEEQTKLKDGYLLSKGKKRRNVHVIKMILTIKMNFFFNNKADSKRKTGYNGVKLSECSIG